MVRIQPGVQNYIFNKAPVSFKKNNETKKSECENKDRLMAEEHSKAPLLTNLKIESDKLKKAFTKYPKKGMKGSKNANFYEFLTMGTVPYLIGSAAMISVFNLAAACFNPSDAQGALKLGKKMGIGVALYGIAKDLSKKLIENPVKHKFGIDVNLPYEKAVYELPDEDNKDNLVSKEYHKAFESVDFPRWDLFYDNKFYGENRNAYFDQVAKKMKISTRDLDHSDQEVKPRIREKVVQTKLFSTITSYLWAATAVGVAMQQPFEELLINPVARFKNVKNYAKLKSATKAAGENCAKYKPFVQDFGERFVKSCKEFVNNSNKYTRVAGKALLGAAVGMTLLGNFITLSNFNKDKGSKRMGASPLIDPKREKVVC